MKAYKQRVVQSVTDEVGCVNMFWYAGITVSQ